MKREKSKEILQVHRHLTSEYKFENDGVGMGGVFDINIHCENLQLFKVFELLIFRNSVIIIVLSY